MYDMVNILCVECMQKMNIYNSRWFGCINDNNANLYKRSVQWKI